MKMKGTIKIAGKMPNFWGKYMKKVPENVKQIIYNQYYSIDTLYIYCDCSMSIEKSKMSIATSYIQNGFVTVKSQVIYPPSDCLEKNVYGELQAIISGLSNFEKYMNNESKKIVIYSDVNDIIKILNKQVTFKKVTSLMKLQNNLIQLFQNKRIENPNLSFSIEYLSRDLKPFNPFLKSAHNGARKALQNLV
ncbi:hypothetical protein [Pallidibacillus thermolactis]|jgi:ribonuclease HI|uniref:hypothetical protein n=1 Tax=Pallidibacillus thermolactis TaxID=251051 RepID=UPI002E21D43D|nr:hypothetical protein [Pallidibacillus thermolactis subsp. kokeshiiformis]